MSFNHIHHTYPHPSPAPGTTQAYLVPPMDSDRDADADALLDLPTVDSIPTCASSPSPSDFAVFPVASIPPGIQLSPRCTRPADPKTTLAGNKCVVIAHAQSQLAVHAVRGLLKDAEHANANDGDESIEVYAMVQDTESHEAREIKALGATLLQYDPTSSSSIRSALGQSGSSTLLLIPPQVDDTVIRTSAILTEARHSIKSILMWSTIGTDNAMDLPPEDDIDPQLAIGPMTHRPARAADPHVPSALLLLKEAEELVTHVGGDVEYVVLRAGFPLQHFFLLSALIQNRGSIPFTSETAHMAPISLSDVGRATSTLIRHTLASGSLPDDYKNKTVLLTGPEPLSGPMIVTAANERLPHPLTFAKVGISDMRSFLLQTHASRFELSLAMGWWRLFMDGKLDTATGDLADMLGGPDRVTKIRDFFEKHVDRFLPADADGERLGAAKYLHETYDEWDEVSSRTSSSVELESGGCSPSKLVSMVVRDAQQHQHEHQHQSPRRANRSIARKCTSDTQHTYFPSRAAGPSRQPSMSTKVVAETRRHASSPSPSLTPDQFIALASCIVADFHADLAQVMHTTTADLRALNATVCDLESIAANVHVQNLIDQLGFMKQFVNACARDARRMSKSVVGNAPAGSGPGMAAKVVGDVAGGNVCKACLRPARLVKKVVGDTGRNSMSSGAAGHQDDDDEMVASRVGVFAKVMHDVAGKESQAGKQGEQTQHGSCVIQ